MHIADDDDKVKFDLKAQLERILADMLAVDPTWAQAIAIQKVSELQASGREREGRYDSIPKAG